MTTTIYGGKQLSDDDENVYGAFEVFYIPLYDMWLHVTNIYSSCVVGRAWSCAVVRGRARSKCVWCVRSVLYSIV